MFHRRNTAKKRGRGHDERAPGLLFRELCQHGHALHLGPPVRHHVQQGARVGGGEEQNVPVLVSEEKAKVRLMPVRLLQARGDEDEALFGLGPSSLCDGPIERTRRERCDVDAFVRAERFD